ncbi:arf-GAP with Rho-GAP domain, ANK repeat and PH domain-containing protein 1 isoform X2 [Bombina bombina]|uniref:arf-GAP with Rho-GAP domain, ANK repeat and PH domain-containing protein 1 isoform X2 n=1 Tax=Bombina bombina TaxID=8345 RepID=UPI00235A5EDA|nr:arf-GAP with Rho-GAP domain, ANK repeat and PH domain-containing protein 1 isoform X2 [Bombina bombina]
MSEGSSLPISEWLRTLKLEQYNEVFQKNNFYTAFDLRAINDEELNKIGVVLPGHRKRILASLQKSTSIDCFMEDNGVKPVPMKRNIFRGTLSSPEQEMPPQIQNTLKPTESCGHGETPLVRPPIPPRKGTVPPIKFSFTPQPASTQLNLAALDEPFCTIAADPQKSPAQNSLPVHTIIQNDEGTEEAPRLSAPPLPAKRHKVESRSPPAIPVRVPAVPPRIMSSMPKSPSAEEEPELSEEISKCSSVPLPKPLPRIPPRELPPKPIPSPRDIFVQEKPDEMERNGNLYELSGEMDGVILTKFRSIKLPSFASDDDLIENGSDDNDIGSSNNRSESPLSTWRSISSLSSGISSSPSYTGTMEESDATSPQSPVIKAGWLDKNPPQGSYIYQKRWVKLDLDYLRYYDNDKDMYSKRFIKTSSILRANPNGDQKFEVTTSNRTFVFRAESDAERNDWVKAFQQVLDEKRFRLSTLLPVSSNADTIDKCGFLEMKGCKPKLYVLVAAERVYLYKNAEDYLSGVGITAIDMNLGNVKDSDKKSFDLTTPYRTFSFSAESEAEKAEWVEAMLQSVSEALSNLEVAKKIWSVEENQRCADCDALKPDWASINLCVVICKRCAGEHRSLGPSISKVRSLKMDNKVWTEELIQLFQKIGNEVSNKFWAANVPPSEAIDMTSGTQERKRFIVAKYREGKYRRYHQLFGNQVELNKALCATVTTSDLTETQALVFCGANVSCNSEDPFYPHPYELAQQAGQKLQMEFLLQNRTSEIPRLDFGNNMERQYYVTRPSVTHNGFLYKTSSMTKPVNERKSREEFSRRWCVLNDDILSYYENNHSSTPNGEIKIDEIVCIAINPPDTHGFESTFEIYTQSERLYLFGVDNAEEAREWVKSITKCFLPLKAEELLNHDFERIGRLQYKGGRSLERAMIGWFSLCRNRLFMYFEDSDTVEVVHLKKLSELSLRDKDVLVLVEKGRITYILGERKLDFSGWVSAIQKAGSTSGDTLSGQQLMESDVPVLVHKCIDHISQFGVGSEGIYRKSGQNSKTTSLLEALKKDARSVVLKEEEHQVDNVSNTLKRFFRDLGEGIFAENYQDWLSVTAKEDESVRIRLYQDLLQKLPAVNRATLKALMTHLYCVQHFSDVNQMNVHNLAIVFGPTLFQTDGQNYKPGHVVEDLISFYLPIFKVEQAEIQKQINIISAIMKIRAENTSAKPGNKHFICTVYLGEKKTETEQIVQIPVTMTAQELSETILERRNIRVRDQDYWSCFEVLEVDDSEVLERPLHFSEKVLPIYHSQKTSSHMIVKKNVHMDQMLQYIRNQTGDSKHGMMKFREEKTLLSFGSNFSDRYFMLNSTTLRMYKDVRSHKPEKEWPIKNLKIYLGIKKKIRPQTNWGFTVMSENEKHERSQWYLCCETLAEMREWFAAFISVQHGSLWPEETSIMRAPRSVPDSRMGNLSLIPIRGSEHDMRRSVAAFTTDPLTLLGNV